MKRKKQSDERRDWLSPQKMALVTGAMKVMSQLGPVGWIGVVAIAAMVLSAFAIYAMMAVATKG